MGIQPKTLKNELEMGVKSTSNVTKSEIKMLDSPSYSSFYTNIELLDIMNTGNFLYKGHAKFLL